MRSSQFSFSILCLLLIAQTAALVGCGRSEAPEASGSARPLPFVPDTKPVPPVKWREATVPRGTPLKMSMIDTLSSRESHAGDPFRALLIDAVVIDGSVIVPSGSNARGVVKRVVTAESGGTGGVGSFSLEFNRIDTPTGASAPLDAKITEVARGRGTAILSRKSDSGEIVAGGAGQEAFLMSNTPVTLVLRQPLQIRVKE